MINIQLSNDSEFDKLVHNALPSGEVTVVATKDSATQGGKPSLVLAFTVQLPDGSIQAVQQVMTVREFAGVYSALRGRYGPGGPESHRYVGNESPFIDYPPHKS